MSKQRLIFILGILVAILPFLGFPRSLKNGLFVLVGVLIAFVGYLIHREKKEMEPKKEAGSAETTPDAFEENRGSSSAETKALNLRKEDSIETPEIGQETNNESSNESR